MSLEKLTWSERELSRDIKIEENGVKELKDSKNKYFSNEIISLGFCLGGAIGSRFTEKSSDLWYFDLAVIVISGITAIYNMFTVISYISAIENAKQELEELKQTPEYKTLESKLK